MSRDIQIIIYEPNIDNEKFNDYVVNDLDSFKESTDIIIANRMSKSQDIPERFSQGYLEITSIICTCPSGGIRHKGLKIPRRQLRAGSSQVEHKLKNTII